MSDLKYCSSETILLRKTPFAESRQHANKLLPESGGMQVPAQLKRGFEQLSGISFENVRIHYASPKPAALGASAYARENHVYLGPGQEKYLPHELGHILQQKQGRVRPTMQIGAVQVNRDPALEQEADQLGRQALQCKAEGDVVRPYGNHVSNNAAQLIIHTHFGAAAPVAVPEMGYPVAGVPINAAYPTIYYESFGDNADQLLNIYRQSCRYPGKTVCILGFNRQVRMLPEIQEQAGEAGIRNQPAVLPDTAQLRRMITEKLQENHEAYIIPFVWIPTQDTGGYTFPYYEVRGKLMAEAEQLAGEAGRFVLFRWIDRDADNDTFPDLPVLRKMARKDNQEIATGGYDWGTDQWQNAGQQAANRQQRANRRHGANQQLQRAQVLNQKKHTFVTALNECERELRAYYWQLFAKMMPDDRNHARMYLPESLLLMNRAAHGNMYDNLEQRLLETNGSHSGQQRESETALGGTDQVLVHADRGEQARSKIHINFRREFSVSKPSQKTVRREGMPDMELKYLERLENFINQHYDEHQGFHNITFGELVDVLKNIRQSAFDNGQWAFVQDQNSAAWEQTQPRYLVNRHPYSAMELQILLNCRRQELTIRLLNTFNQG